jgi:hypothetical protein
MKKFFVIPVFVLLFLGFAPRSQARVEVQTTREVTPTGVIVNTTHLTEVGSDSPATGDPFGNRPLPKSALKGPPSTWAPCPNTSKEPRCLKFKRQQLSSPYWKPKRK